MKMKLVFIENQRPVTDSLTVAEAFGKRHDNVLRDIKELECSSEFSLLNFEETAYTASNGQNYPKYIITQDGFAFLVMGYTGKEAARFKELYINEFNIMKSELATIHLQNQFNLQRNYKEALLSLISQVEENEKVTSENILLNAKVEEDKPKVQFAETCMT